MTWPFGKGNPPRAILIDLDGTLYTGNESLPGASSWPPAKRTVTGKVRRGC